ncbi:MAG: divalent-cation tolerance protein CutA [Herminiimonas sp.]|nr:divalent-cation tolerance protein CutA [Herminiimonas sp.]
MDQVLLVMTSMPDEGSAHDLASLLVDAGLAACVHILPGMQSVYRWDGVLHTTSEVTVQIKTVQSCYAEVEQAVLQSHPYDVPEIIAVPVVDGLPAYLDWVRQSTRKDRHA